jgi:pyridoxamine 5'-phosphate oxidase
MLGRQLGQLDLEIQPLVFGAAKSRERRYGPGFRVHPDAIEFWIHREHRLHDREIYFRNGRQWRRCRLLP